MKRTVILGLALAALLLAGFGAQSQAQPVGVHAFSGFQWGVDARALAMGGAFVAVANGYSAPYWNPAGLTRAQGTALGGMNTNKFGQDIQFNYVGATAQLAGFRVGAGFLSTMISGIETFGPGGEATGTVNDNELLFIGSTAFGLPFGGLPITVGGSAKYYSQSLAGESAQGFGGDAGLLLDLGNFDLGATVTDVTGSRINWSTGSVDQVDQNIRVGGALDLSAPIPWTLSGQYDVDAELLRGGVEFNLTQQIALRGGVRRPLAEDGEMSFSAGAGLALGSFNVDAAFVQNQVLGNSLVISGQFQF